VDRGRICQYQLIKFRNVIYDGAVIKGHCKLPVLHADRRHRSDVTVEHLFVVVVPYLHDLVVSLKEKASPAETLPFGVQLFL